MRQICKTIVAAATIALAGISVNPSAAAPADRQPAAVAQDASEVLAPTDVSAARRRYRRDDRAAMGAFMGIIGTIAGIAAAERYRRDCYRYGYCGGYPYYAYPAPPYPYYGPYQYGPRYYDYGPRYYPYW